MRFSIGHIFRKPGLDRAAFRHHYESRHTALAQAILPRFSLYVRNHVVDCSDAGAPDCISEFGLDTDAQVGEIAAILGGERGRPLLQDELLFMDKTRNAPFPVARRELAASPAGYKYPMGHKYPIGHKYVVAMAGAAAGLPWPGAVGADAGLHAATLCTAQEDDYCWLLGRSEERQAPARLRQQLLDAGLPVRWCALVEEARGYPAEGRGRQG